MFGLFKKKDPSVGDEPLVMVFVPALVLVLLNKEKEKDSPLTHEEVESIRDSSVCMSMRLSIAKKMEKERGFPDLNPENCWEEWSTRRAAYLQKKGHA